MRENQGGGHVESGAARMCSRSPRHGGTSRALAPTEPGAGRVEPCVPREFKALLYCPWLRLSRRQRRGRRASQPSSWLYCPRLERSRGQRREGGTVRDRGRRRRHQLRRGRGRCRREGPDGGRSPMQRGRGGRSPRRWRPASSRSDRCGTRGQRVRATCSTRPYWAMSSAWAIRMKRRGKKEERVAEGLFYQGRQVREQSPPVVDLVTFVESPFGD